MISNLLLEANKIMWGKGYFGYQVTAIYQESPYTYNVVVEITFSENEKEFDILNRRLKD